MDKWFVSGALYDRDGNHVGTLSEEVQADGWADAREKAWQQGQKDYPKANEIVYSATHKM